MRTSRLRLEKTSARTSFDPPRCCQMIPLLSIFFFFFFYPEETLSGYPISPGGMFGLGAMSRETPREASYLMCYHHHRDEYKFTRKKMGGKLRRLELTQCRWWRFVLYTDTVHMMSLSNRNHISRSYLSSTSRGVSFSALWVIIIKWRERKRITWSVSFT